MSFITKRERVFNEYLAPLELPVRNEGKLKAYSSCTDARAWSHFMTDKTEHLVEIIKRNNEICRGKYVPVNVIIEMMVAAKNAEIERLKRKIGQLEQMLAAFDQLELSCEQKCEISTAHAMIRQANKSLEALPPLELDMSGYTEGIDSDAFQASIRQRGVEWCSRQKDGELGMESQGFGPYGFDPLGYEGLGGIEPKSSKLSKNDQSDFLDRCSCDVSTSAHDTRVEELEESLISKDAKLNAMQNTIAVMENDVCEPYCIYAHIFTALEKIYGILRQNEKYRLFLDLMSSGKDTRCLDIKGKILFKLKILEKFCTALISPCSQRFKYDESCECYAAQVETIYASTQPEHLVSKPSDVMRTHLVADVMSNDDMKEIITKETREQQDNGQANDVIVTDNFSIDLDNIKRIKSLQADYEALMNAYEDVRFERDSLKIREQKYGNLEKELEDCRTKLREYNMLYNEREYYRKRSEDLDSLKEQYMVLADESSGLETQLKAEFEINHIKTGTIDELRNDNIALEKKLNDLTIAYEKERNGILCKLQEADCKIMCQEQQIKSLSSQIDRIIDQDPDNIDKVYKSATIINEIEALKDQIKILNNALYASEDEKQQLEDQFEDKLKLINELKMEIEEWKSQCEKTLQRNDYLEKYTESFRDEVRRLVEENKELSQEVDEKTTAVSNLLNVINNKSQEMNKLMHNIELEKEENKELKNQLQKAKDTYSISFEELDNEKKEVLKSLQLAKQESKELLDKVKDYDEVLQTKEKVEKSLAVETENCNEIKNMLIDAIEANKKLQQDLLSYENNNSILLQEIQRLREINNLALDNINSLQNDKDEFKNSFELAKKEIEILEDKLKGFQDLQEQYEKVFDERNKLVNELQGKAKEVDDAITSVELTKKESEHLLEKVQRSENLKEEMIKLSKDYRNLVNEKEGLQKEITNKTKELDSLLQTIGGLETENSKLSAKSKKVDELETELNQLKKAYDTISNEKAILQNDFDRKTQEVNNLMNRLEEKIDENKNLADQIDALERQHKENVTSLQDVNLRTQLTLGSLQRESEELLNKLKDYESLLNKYEDLKISFNRTKNENDSLQSDLKNRITELNVAEQERDDLKQQAQEILLHNEKLQKSLIDATQEIIQYSTQGPFDDVVREIEDMKNEKVANSNKIKELLDKLDEQDNIICSLNEDLLARDDKIAVLQNHINSLDEEIMRLHDCLAEVVNTGEQIKDNSYKKIDQTLNKMEAHHSKATHNMKMELAKLHNVNAQLEEQLSVHKIRSEESFQDKHKYISQIVHLQNDWELIATDIKQLEISCIGDSNISPTSCGVEDILKSLDKIRKCIDARNSKSNSLEQTLQKVQNSSQLLLSKADEAKKLLEKEKQKIINEKEQAITDRLNMEKQLLELKVQLEEQTAQDADIIKDLKAEILNQKLIIDKLNDTTGTYIANLKEEMQALEDVYQNSLAKIAELESKLEHMTEENDKTINILESVKTELKEKSKQVNSLQKSLNELKNKQMRNKDVQAEHRTQKKDTETQTETSSFDKELGPDKIRDNYVQDENNVIPNKSLGLDKVRDNYVQNENTVKSNNTATTPEHKRKSQMLNEVQILTANIEPPLEIVKSYVEYKRSKLAPGKLEQYSISTVTGDSLSANPNLLDIYKRPIDMHSVSSKAIKAEGELASTSGLTSSNSRYQDPLTKLQQETSSDKDMFLIYKDSDSSYADSSSKGKDVHNRQQPILVEAVTISQDRDSKMVKSQRPTELKLHDEDDNDRTNNIRGESKNVIPHRPADLEIHNENNLDRTTNISGESKRVRLHRPAELKIHNENDIDRTTSIHGESKLVRSHQPAELKIYNESDLDRTLNIRNSNKPSVGAMRSETVKDSNISYDYDTGTDASRSREKSNESNDQFNQDILNSKESQKLSRVDGDFVLFKDKLDQGNNFGLEYILDSVKQEISYPEKMPAVHKDLHKSFSDDLYQRMKSNSENQTPLIFASSDDKTTSAQSKSSDPSQSKLLKEQSVMVNIDPSDYYENKIRNLSQQLESAEKEHKKRISAIKAQYDSHIKNILNDHDQGVKSIQSLHEETLQDVIKFHENEVENLRSMSIEAMRKADKLQRDNRLLKSKLLSCTCGCVVLDAELAKVSPIELKKRRSRCREETRLMKTDIEAFSVRPKLRHHGPCTCSLDVNVSDTIRNIFEQVDVEQRKLAEHAYLKYIAEKIMTANFESLDVQELSYLHLKVCRMWKHKLNKEEALQKRIDSLECELLSKQRCSRQHFAELDRKVDEERRRLQEAREAVCRCSPTPDLTESLLSTSNGDGSSPLADTDLINPQRPQMHTVHTACSCNSLEVRERRSAGDLIGVGPSSTHCKKPHRAKPESRATLAKLDSEERRMKKTYDEPPTRLRRPSKTKK
ncbi:hypothetical protein NE865_07920 [Phthorimaea operculella]|nr:hypothetical protein NE865_07920 [Phthorimaea operculella]